MRSVSRRTLAKDDDSDYAPDPLEEDDIVHLPVPSFPPVSDGARGSTGTGSTGSTLTPSGRRGSADTMKGGSSSSSRNGSLLGETAAGVVRPIIIVRAEHSSMPRSTERDKKQHLTCMVTIEMPPRWNAPMLHRVRSIAEEPDQQPYPTAQPGSIAPPASIHSDSHSQRRPSSPTPSSTYSAYAYGSTGTVPSNPFAGIVADLRERMADWKGHSPDEFGNLKLYNNLSVRKDKSVREFIVYVRVSMKPLMHQQGLIET